MNDWAAARSEKWPTNLHRMEAMLQPIDEPLIRTANLDLPYRIADVACGGGGTTLAILRKAPVGSVVHGFDISPASIEVARRRADFSGKPVTFEIADLERNVPDLPYARLISRFGVMFFWNPIRRDRSVTAT